MLVSDLHAHITSVSWSLMEEQTQISPQGPHILIAPLAQPPSFTLITHSHVILPLLPLTFLSHLAGLPAENFIVKPKEETF